MMKKPIYTGTLMKIFGAYMGSRAEYKEGERWIKMRVDGNMLNMVAAGRECVLLLRPIHIITIDEVVYLERLKRKLDAANGQCVSEGSTFEEIEYTDEEKKAMREHFIDSNVADYTYPIVDFLRRSGYHLPIYGLDLYKSKLARPIYINETKKPVNA